MKHKHDDSPESKSKPEELGASMQEGATRTIRGQPANNQPPSGNDETEDAMRMPFEQDQSSDSSAEQPHDKMRQAKKDLDAGLVDTDLWGSPGQDAERQRELLEREKARTDKSDSDKSGD